MKCFTKTAIVILTTFIFYSCGPAAEEKTERTKALVDSAVNGADSNQGISNEKSAARKVDTLENVTNYDWTGKYTGGDDHVSYTLTVNNDAPLRWAEFGWELEAVGIQAFYKIKGYALRDENGNLDLHFLETVDGAFYQEENMDMNKTMFKINKKGNVFKPINGTWKVTDFISTFKK